MNDQLSQLRDIHLPEPVSAWPPAWGWWLLLGLILVIIILLTIWLYRRYQRGRLQRRALKELARIEQDYQQQGDTRHYLQALNTLLKYIACQRPSNRSVATLTGDSWLNYLNQSGNTQVFTQGNGRLLGDAVYRPAVSKEELSELSAQCRQWIRRQKP